MSEDKELKVMESRVREAMDSCPQAKVILQTLFGEQLTTAPGLQVGDIVQYVKQGMPANNCMGRIVCQDGSVCGIEFFENIHGNNLSVGGGPRVPDGHGWFGDTSELRFIYRPIKL